MATNEQTHALHRVIEAIAVALDSRTGKMHKKKVQEEPRGTWAALTATSRSLCRALSSPPVEVSPHDIVNYTAMGNLPLARKFFSNLLRHDEQDIGEFIVGFVGATDKENFLREHYAALSIDAQATADIASATINRRAFLHYAATGAITLAAAAKTAQHIQQAATTPDDSNTQTMLAAGWGGLTSAGIGALAAEARNHAYAQLPALASQLDTALSQVFSEEVSAYTGAYTKNPRNQLLERRAYEGFLSEVRTRLQTLVHQPINSFNRRELTSLLFLHNLDMYGGKTQVCNFIQREGKDSGLPVLSECERRALRVAKECAEFLCNSHEQRTARSLSSSAVSCFASLDAAHITQGHEAQGFFQWMQTNARDQNHSYCPHSLQDVIHHLSVLLRTLETAGHSSDSISR